MEKTNHKPTQAEQPHAQKTAHGHDEEHAHGNYRFALKVLIILAAIILVIVILKATGVPIAIKDWLVAVSDCICAPSLPSLF